MINTRLILKRSLSEFNIGAVLYLTMILAGLLVFQNCSEPVDLSDEDRASFSDDLPFAYDVKMDTFAYMSCYNMTEVNYDRRALFNFRIGAYESGSGIQLTEDFKRRTSSFKPQAKIDTLFRSPTSAGSILQFSARPTRQDLQRIVVNDRNSGAVFVGRDLDNFFGGAPLSSPRIAERLVELEGDDYVNYMSGIQGLDGRLAEASLRFHETLKQVTDQFNQREAMLTLTYTPESNERSYAARTPDPERANSIAYGYKFTPDFRGVRRKHGAASEGGFRGYWQPSGSVIENRTVVSLRETNMINNQSHDWSCPGDLRLMVADPYDEKFLDSNPTNDPCQRTASIATVDEPAALNARDKKRLEVIRRVLRVEDYYVNLEQNCVIPKDAKNSCYPRPSAENNITVNLNYAMGSASSYTCNDDPTTGSYECPNYVSICVREPLPN